METNVGEVPMTQDGQGIPPPEMEPQIAGGVYAAATAAAPAATGGFQTGALQQPPIPSPPGIAPPMDPNMPLVTFMQLMNNQMQTFMQQMQSQMRSQMPGQPAPPSGSSQNRLDERCFRRLERISNKCDDWKEWRLHFLTVIGECNAKVLHVPQGE